MDCSPVATRFWLVRTWVDHGACTCRYALNTLMNIFHTSRLPTGLKQETLARMVRTLLLRLVDDNLGKQPEGEALLKVGIRQVLEDHLFVTRHTAR
jgi:hypothetical protein